MAHRAYTQPIYSIRYPLLLAVLRPHRRGGARTGHVCVHIRRFCSVCCVCVPAMARALGYCHAVMLCYCLAVRVFVTGMSV